MKWINVTCDATKHIIPAQRHLFRKYCFPYLPEYIDLENKPIEDWGKNVAAELPDDEYIIFGLDDYLPIDSINRFAMADAHDILISNSLERFELGVQAKGKVGQIEKWDYIEYGEKTPYSVSCQFSIWKTSALKRELQNCTTPWNFEVHGKAKAGCFKGHAMVCIEESALSNRQKGKTNLCGLKLEDIKELTELNLVKDVIYGWKGNAERTREAYGTKYQDYY